MKKFLSILMLVLVAQLGLAQNTNTHPTVAKLIEKQGLREQLAETKTGLNDLILEDKKEDFSKKYDEIVNTFVDKFGKIITKHFTEEQLQNIEKDIAEKGEAFNIGEHLPNDVDKFQEDLTILQTEIGMELQDLIMEYGNPDLFQE